MRPAVGQGVITSEMTPPHLQPIVLIGDDRSQCRLTIQFSRLARRFGPSAWQSTTAGQPPRRPDGSTVTASRREATHAGTAAAPRLMLPAELAPMISFAPTALWINLRSGPRGLALA